MNLWMIINHGKVSFKNEIHSSLLFLQTWNYGWLKIERFWIFRYEIHSLIFLQVYGAQPGIMADYKKRGSGFGN